MDPLTSNPTSSHKRACNGDDALDSEEDESQMDSPISQARLAAKKQRLEMRVVATGEGQAKLADAPVQTLLQRPPQAKLCHLPLQHQRQLLM